MSIVNGHFTIKFKPVGGAYADLGDTETGFRLIEQQHRRPINRTDSKGDTEVDAIQAGGDVEIQFTYLDYDSIKAALYQQFTAGQPIANVGKLLTSLAGSLVLTPVAGTAAATDYGTGKSLVADKAIIVSDLEQLLSLDHRKGPVTFHCYPNAANSNKAYDIITTPT